MTVDRDVIAEQDQVPPDEVSTATLAAYAVAAIALVGWFLFGWLVQRQGFINSIGESAGAGSALLLVVAVIGTVRRNRR